MLGTWGCLPRLGKPAELLELVELERTACGRASDEGRSGVRRRFDVGGVIRPERNDCAEAGAVRDGVWLREEVVFCFPARAEDAFSRPLLRQLPKAAAS